MKYLKFNHSNIISLIESTSNGKTWKVLIIEEGLSKNGKYYSEGTLRRAIPLFEKSKVCFYEWKGKEFNHIPVSIERMRPEGFPLQTAGFLENIKYETVKIEGREVTGLTGHLQLIENKKVNDLKDILVNAWNKGMKNLLGLSINAEGPAEIRMINGQPISVVKDITKVFSTDFVTQPAAGGGLLKIIESINLKGGEEKMFKKILESLMKWNKKVLEGIDINNVTEEEVIGIFESVLTVAKANNLDTVSQIESVITHMKEKKFDEALKVLESLTAVKELSEEELLNADDSTLTEEQKKKKADFKSKKEKKEKDAQEALDGKNKVTEAEKKARALEAKLVEIDNKLKVNESRELLDLALSESKLPQPVKDKILAGFKGQIVTKEKITESIKLETSVLAKLVESGSIIDLGGDHQGVIVEREPVTRLQASMDLMFGYKPEDTEKESYKGLEKFNSLREAYILYTDDPSISGNLGAKALARLSEATEANFAYALGYSMQRRMLPEYKAIDPLWKLIATIDTIKDFKLQERILWGGFGVLPTVQDARTSAGSPIDSATPTYPELGFPQDTEATYAVLTKGGMITLTRRMIIDDDLKILTAIPKKIGKAAANTLNQFVFDLMLGFTTGVNVATIYDSIVLYHTKHKNKRTGALGYDNLSDILNDMYYQVETGYKSDVDTQLEIAGTTLAVTAGTGQYFKAGDKIWMDGEICEVTVVATNDLTIIRGLYNTTDAQHVVGVDVLKVTQFLALENPYLWVPRSLRGVAIQLKTSEKNPENVEQGVNTIRDSFEPKVSPYLRGDENNYYLSAKTADVEGIEIGFLNGKQDPEILVQDNPTVGNVFVYDTIRYKVRHEYGGAVVNYRAYSAGIVA